MKMFGQFKLTKELKLLLFTFGVTILLYFAFPDYYYHRTLDVQAQQQEQQQHLSPTMAVNIISPMIGQQVPAGELTISGTSTDNPTTDCTVYADWNNTKLFQKAVATGPGGEDDYSTWTFTYTPEYHLITNGINTLTSELSCVDDNANGNLTKSYSVKVIGIKESSESGTSEDTSGSTSEDTSGSTSVSARGGTSEDTSGSTSVSARGGTSTGTSGSTSGSARGDIVESPRGDTSRGTSGSIPGSR
jgi:hypothetical protein